MKFQSSYQYLSIKEPLFWEKRKQDHNDCVVRALAISTNKSYSKTHDFCCKFLGRQHRRGVLGASSKIRQLTNKKTNLFHSTFSRSITEVKFNGNVKEFASSFKRGHFFILVRGHALASINGTIIDNDQFKTKGWKRKIEAVFEIK